MGEFKDFTKPKVFDAELVGKKFDLSDPTSESYE